jgi:DNA polymerase I
MAIDRPLLLIDAYNILYRAFFALPESIVDENGNPANALYGFFSMLTRVVRDLEPSGLAVATESDTITWRQRIYPPYKQGRTTVPPKTAVRQALILPRLLELLNVTILSADGYEADDLIASAVATVSRRPSKTNVLIVSNDRDLFQLVSEAVQLLWPLRGVSKYELVDPGFVAARYGVAPSRYCEFAALRGDPSDNIPGVPGIGPRGAAAILRSCESLDELLEGGAGTISARLWERVDRNRDIIRKNLALIRLDTTVRLSSNPADAAVPKEIGAAAAAEFSRSGLSGLVGRLADAFAGR